MAVFSDTMAYLIRYYPISLRGGAGDSSVKHSMIHYLKSLFDNISVPLRKNISEAAKNDGNINTGNDSEKTGKKKNLFRRLQLLSLVIFLISACLFVNEVIIQPYLSKKVVEEVQSLYSGSLSNDKNNSLPATPSNNGTQDDPQVSLPDERDSEGRLVKFYNLLRINTDVKGWIIVPDSEIDYPVLQSSEDDPEYYLTRNIYREHDKQGSLFIDIRSSVEKNTKNIVIYGHNMKTGAMFHDIARYQDLNFYKERPIIYFDSLYQTGIWKIFAVIITNGSEKYGDTFFDYTRSEFADNNDFLNFVYQLRVRSLFDFNVDINEDDQLLTLSTCSYELPDYRTVVAARKVREGESPEVDTDAKKNDPLYPESWYKTYGGEPPKVSTFEQALKAGEIAWYSKND